MLRNTCGSRLGVEPRAPLGPSAPRTPRTSCSRTLWTPPSVPCGSGRRATPSPTAPRAGGRRGEPSSTRVEGVHHAGNGNFFIGNDLFFLSKGFEGKDAFHNWFFQWAFAATAATIVSGAVAERCSMGAQRTARMRRLDARRGTARQVRWLLGVPHGLRVPRGRVPRGTSSTRVEVAPAQVVHWVWSSDGWRDAASVPRRASRGSCSLRLSAFIHDPIYNVGVVDFAGCGVVHMAPRPASGVSRLLSGRA